MAQNVFVASSGNTVRLQLLEQYSGRGEAIRVTWHCQPTDQDIEEFEAWFRKQKPFPINITGQVGGRVSDPETDARERSGLEAWKRKRGIGRVN